MPKLQCPCGFVHDLSPIPDDGWIVVADRDYEALIEAECRQSRVKGEPSAFVGLSGRLYECPQCGRIMWNTVNESNYRIFRPEE
jgi:hypothetical protein